MELGDLPPTERHSPEESGDEQMMNLSILETTGANLEPEPEEVTQHVQLGPGTDEPRPAKRRVSGYTVFVHQLHATLMKESPESSFSARASLIATLWSMMSKSERDLYAKTADEVYNNVDPPT